jgi:hypothetical protein
MQDQLFTFSQPRVHETEAGLQKVRDYYEQPKTWPLANYEQVLNVRLYCAFASLNIIQVLEHLHLSSGNGPARHFWMKQ